MTRFVQMYHPQLAETAEEPVRVELNSVDDHAARGWLLVDPDVTPPTSSLPYFTRSETLSQVGAGTGPLGAALRAASVAAVQDADEVNPTGDWDFATAPTVAGQPLGATPPDASTTTKGIVEMATPGETSTGTSTGLAVTPAGVKAVRDALPASFAPRDVSSIALLGDSHTEKTTFSVANALVAYQDEGYWSWTSLILGSRLRLAGVFAYPGQTTASILTHINEAAASGAGWLLEQGGTNDVLQNVPAATIQANKAAIWQAAMAAGMRVVATTIIPQTSWTAAQKRIAQTVNAWMRRQSTVTRGVVICAWDAPLTDPATGNAASGMLRSDGIHTTSIAAERMGARLAAVLDPLLPKTDMLGVGGDPLNLIANSAMTGNNGGLATGWTAQTAAGAGSTATLSKVARTDDVPGEWQQIVIPPGNTDGLQFFRTFDTGFVAGDILSGFMEFQRGSDWANIPTSGQDQFRLRIQTYQGYYSYGLNHVGPEAFPGNGVMPLSGVLKTPPFAMPAGHTGGLLALEFRGQGTLRIGRTGVLVNQD